ncbi:ABC transporter ATP-binding protein [Thermotalea metallivorans]|uniref:Oligopeptide transport ATP-binding protein OppD n=1 Tax=Thermotalea metallivorans TaxID=520762 RepID=A0A140KZQ8_9FIRM|nr:ABC transporter ATP-binding protein [Thermotalea metallivorans]KXG73783.1 Oligopeptide transport ATP-binding protein OppD [Thermotalea metallivorans]
MEKLLEIKNLKTYFYTDEGIVKAVDDVSLKINKGETMCIVGESGCGKSITAMSILRLIPNPPGRIEGGEIVFEGRDLLKLSEEEVRSIRGNEISMIFQEPMTSLNPVFTIGNQIIEAIMLHQNLSKKAAVEKAVEVLKLVGIPRADEIINAYPHELSGGMRQRVMIAMAMVCNPKLLIADEPTTALDVTIQAQILDLMRKLKEDTKTSIMLITHDLGVVAEMADYISVMYSGKIVEEAKVLELFKNPLHPYTSGLLASKPQIHIDKEKLYAIPGQVPSSFDLPKGCYFYPRCERAMDICEQCAPKLKQIHDGHYVACHLYGGEENE